MSELAPIWVWAFVVVGGYLLGSISGSLLLGRLKQVDIRSLGSGNAGGTNAFRTQGWRFALAVVVIDMGKGAMAAGVLPWVVSAYLADPQAKITLGAVAGFAAILGHVWPLYFGFKGGKGAGTAVGAVAVLAPSCIGPMFIIWLVTLLATGYVGLATILAGLILIPAMIWFGPDPTPMSLIVFAVAIAVLIILTHRSNIARLIQGNENRFNTQKLWRRR